MGIAVMVGLSVLLTALWSAAVTVPKWFGRSLHRHRLWSFRDDLVTDYLDGKLPHHPATFELMCAAETTIAMAHRVTLTHVRLARRMQRQLSQAARDQVTATFATTKNLSSEQAAYIDQAWDRLGLLRTGMVLTGSWRGLFYVAMRIPKAIRLVNSEPSTAATGAAKLTEESLAVARAATDDVAQDTTFGEQVRQGVSDLFLQPALAC